MPSSMYKLLYFLSKERSITRVGFEVLSAVTEKGSVFWDIIPSSPVKIKRRFSGTRGHVLQNRTVSQARNQHEAGSIQGILLQDISTLY
jgi:hypothetical protein